MSNLKGILFGLLAFALFSMHDVFVKLLGAVYSPIQVVFFSVTFGFPFLVFRLLGDTSRDNLIPRHPVYVLIRTATVIGSALSVFSALSYIPLAEFYIIMFTMPMMLTLMAIPILGERVGIHRFGAIVVGLVGVVVALDLSSSSLGIGHALAAAGAFFSAVSSVIVRKIGRDERDVVLIVYPMVGGFVVMGSLLIWNYQPMEFVDLTYVGIVALLAFLAMASMITAYKNAEAAAVAPMQYSQFLWALLFGYLFFGEFPDSRAIIGAVLIVASGFYIIYREGWGGGSANQPVLRTRSRVAGGSYLRIGPRLRHSFGIRTHRHKPKSD